MELARQRIVRVLQNAGMREMADQAETTLPDPVDSKSLDEFCTANGISSSFLMDRMGASP